MSVQTKPFVTPEEYLERERRAAIKSEYYRGEVFAMPGASRNHSVLHEADPTHGTVAPASVGCTLSLDDLYANVTLEDVSLR